MEICLAMPHYILNEAVQVCNKILSKKEHLAEIFMELAKAFCDDAEAANAITTEGLGDILFLTGRVITIYRDDDAEDYTMMSIPSDDIIIVNKHDLPDEEICARHSDRPSKFLIFLFVSLIHECSHLFTKSLNILANNLNSKEEKVDDTPEKIGRATINHETEKDAGAGLEMILFGGLMCFVKGCLTVTVVDHPNIDIEDPHNSKVYEITNEIAQVVAENLRNWLHSGTPSPPINKILAELHYSRLPIQTKSSWKEEMLRGIRTKFHGHIHKVLEHKTTWGGHLPEGFIQKKQPSKIPGVKK